ncbi:MAG TPA: penicillin acylase family protein [Steroidobacteraceae bacterium]|nr:penicillin acylase family protein [Steroidobacteraceae bacterium]
MRTTLLRIGASLGALALLAAAAGWLVLRASLPVIDGQLSTHAVGERVTIERDADGATTVSGRSRDDVAFALGYAHAQDRFFQMDLLRRAAAGELSALLGEATVDTDRELRVHRFRAVARAAIAASSPAQRALVEAYAAGVNAGLASLRARPFEYLVLRAVPEPWRPEDSVLVTLAMFVQLQEHDGHRKIERGLIQEALPASAARFVYAAASDWEASLDDSHSAPPVVPAADDYDLARVGPLNFEPPARHTRTRPAAGSNNWAIAGARTATGAALVANDMHLGIRVPNTWYRARLRVAAAGGPPVDVTGVTLPGTPAVVTGSNTHVAWAFTNSYGDFEDVVRIVPDPAAPDRYLSAAGPRPFTHMHERIEVRGGAAIELDVVGTEWGPVVWRDEAGRGYALEWTAHDPAAVNLELVGLESATGIADALAVAARAGIPAQNFVTGDAAGHIAWTIAGQIPRRRGGEPSLPRPSTDPELGFAGWVAAAERPAIVDPPGGQIATANARVVGGAALATIGDGGYDRGARARQILTALSARDAPQTPRDALAVQLDDRALFLARWQQLLVGLLDTAAVAGHPRRAELKAVLRTWSGSAAVPDAAYRLVRAFRAEVERRVFYALIAPARAKNPGFRFVVPASFEGPLWTLLEQRPAHLLPPGASDWPAFLLAAADAAVAGVESDCAKLADCTWGRANLTRIRHPLSSALPLLGSLLDMPAEMLPGDEDMPRVQGPAFGASERFAVSPGHEAEAYFEMPGGQSGHPLSPYYRAGHERWAHGEPAAGFLPGAALHTLTLSP